MDERYRPLHFPFIAPPLSFGAAPMRASHFGGLGSILWDGFSYKIRWRLWSRTAAEAAPGARRFVAQNGFCSTKTHLARPLGRMSEKKVRLSKVFQFGGKVRAALFVGKTFVFNRKPRRGSPRKPLYIAVFVQLFICVVTHLLTCNCISE